MSDRVTQTTTGIFFDNHATGGQNTKALLRYTPVSLATGQDLTDAATFGIRTDAPIVVPTPVSGGIATREVIGIAMESARSGTEVLLATAGDVHVMVNAAVALNARVFAAATTTRTSAQTPLINLFDANLPIDPSYTLTYLASLIDDVAVAPQTTSANVLFFPVGTALRVAASQYEVIPVRLNFTPFYA